MRPSGIFISLNLLLIVFLTSACQKENKLIGAQFIAFGEEGIQPDYDYIFHPIDTTEKKTSKDDADINLILRYNQVCNIRNIRFNIESSSLDMDSISKFEISVPLFDHNDEKAGKGGMGIYEIKYPLLKISLPQDGLYVGISTPEKNTRGILSLGVTVEEKNNGINSRTF